MFPTAHSIVYYNEAGEPLGWDEPEYSDERDISDIEQEWYLKDEYYDDEDNTCEGHESLNGSMMGVTVFCDGSCR
jgi:hypothetical protein